MTNVDRAAIDLEAPKLGHDIGPFGAKSGGIGRSAHFFAAMSNAGYPGGPSRSTYTSGNELSMREAQHMLTTPSDVFHSSISGGMPGWDTSRAGMPVY